MKSTKPIFLSDDKAVKLVRQRAKTENRSLANAAAQTIIEALEEPESQTHKDTLCRPVNQG